MLYMILFVCNVCLCFIICLNKSCERKSILRLVLGANNLFCIEYLLLSCVLILVEWFSVQKALAGLLILNFLLSSALCIRNRRENCRYICGNISWNLLKSERVLIGVMCFLCIPFIHLTTEDIGTVSDLGGYYAHTLLLMDGQLDDIYTLNEMGKISEGVDQGIRSLQKKQSIFYHYDNSDQYYVFALKTWCVFPALFGKMFGLFHCMISINYLYILVVCNMFYLCKKIAANPVNVYIAFGVFAMAPLVLYIGKAGLTELIMLFLGILGLDYILEQDFTHYILGGVCIGLIGFCHISIFVYMPIITGMLFLFSCEEKYTKLAYVNILQLAFYMCSIWYAYKISPVYVEKQYARFTLHGKIDYIILFAGISLFVAILIILQFGIYYKKNKVCSVLSKWFLLLKKVLYSKFTLIVGLVFLIILAKTIYNAYMLGFTDEFAISQGYDAGSWNLREKYIHTGFQAISYLNLINVGRATGWIGLLVFVAIPFWKGDIREATKTFYYIALYGLSIFTIIQVDTPFNYYASRYFLPVVVPFITITIVSFVESRNWCLYILCAALLYNRYFWPAFLIGAPQYGQYQMLQEVLDTIPEEEIVLCNIEGEYVNVRLTSNLRIINRNEVYNLDNYEEVNDFYEERDKYIISEVELDTDAELLLHKSYQSQYSFGNGKNGTYDMNIGTYEIPVYIYYVEQGKEL